MLSSAHQSLDFGYALAFFEKLLRRQSLCRLSEEYPLVFQEESSELVHIGEMSFVPSFQFADSSKKGRLWLYAADQQIQAGLATLHRQVRMENQTELQLLFVGSVVTDEAYRHRGLQRELFQAVEKAALEQKIDFLVLWSNQLDFYKKLGFELGGLQATWSCPHRAPLVKSAIPVRFGFSRDFPLTPNWYQAFRKKPLTIERSFEEMQKLWQIPQMQIAATENAYALYRKGEDFDGMCHEWAGPAEEVLACFDRLRTLRSDVRFLSAGHIQDHEEMDVIRRIEAHGFESRLEYLGLFKNLGGRFSIQDLQPETLKLAFFVWGLDSI